MEPPNNEIMINLDNTNLLWKRDKLQWNKLVSNGIYIIVIFMLTRLCDAKEVHTVLCDEGWGCGYIESRDFSWNLGLNQEKTGRIVVQVTRMMLDIRWDRKIKRTMGRDRHERTVDRHNKEGRQYMMENWPEYRMRTSRARVIEEDIHFLHWGNISVFLLILWQKNFEQMSKL